MCCTHIWRQVKAPIDQVSGRAGFPLVRYYLLAGGLAQWPQCLLGKREVVRSISGTHTKKYYLLAAAFYGRNSKLLPSISF